MPATDVADRTSSQRRLAVVAGDASPFRRAAPFWPAWRTAQGCAGFDLADS